MAQHGNDAKNEQGLAHPPYDIRENNQNLAFLAHELRNPLAVLSSAAEVLARLAAGGDAPLEQVAGVVKRQTRTMRQLVDNLLDISRIDTGRLGVSMRRLDLAEIVRDSVDDYRAAIERAGLRCDVTVSSPLWILGDALKLGQVLGNLLSNAMKFTPAPGSVHIDAQASGSHACLSVRDTGVGLAPELVAVVFERYRQADPGSHGGLGLGLPIAKELVERHGGTIEASSGGVNRGCTIAIRLPLAS